MTKQSIPDARTSVFGPKISSEPETLPYTDFGAPKRRSPLFRMRNAQLNKQNPLVGRERIFFLALELLANSVRGNWGNYVLFCYYFYGLIPGTFLPILG